MSLILKRVFQVSLKQLPGVDNELICSVHTDAKKKLNKIKNT